MYNQHFESLSACRSITLKATLPNENQFAPHTPKDTSPKYSSRLSTLVLINFYPRQSSVLGFARDYFY